MVHAVTMTRAALAITALFLLVPLAGAHVYNHEDKHEVCQVYGAPQGHAIGDGHAHTHDPVVGAGMHDHDPCKQTRMNYPGYENNAPLHTIKGPMQELPPGEMMFSDGDPSNSEMFVGGEAYQFPVPEGAWKRQTSLVVTSDLQAAGMGFPGDGSYTNPYIVENYIISGNMLFKNTEKCYVFRNNIIVNRVIEKQIIPDPLGILELANLTPHWEAVKKAAEKLRSETLNTSATWESLRSTWDANKVTWDSNKAAKDAELADYQRRQAEWDQAFADFEDEYVAVVQEMEWLAADFESWASQYGVPAQPTKGHASYIDLATQTVHDMAALQPAFEAYQEDLDNDRSNEDVEGWMVGNPPPMSPPPGYWGDASDWAVERDNYNAYVTDVQYRIDQYWSSLMASEPDAAAYATFVSKYAAFQIVYDDFVVDYNQFIADYNAFYVDYNAFQIEKSAVMASTATDIADADAHFAKAAAWTYEYEGSLGTKTFNKLDELLAWALQKIFGIVDSLPLDPFPIDPNVVTQNTGQLILDWNGQCIHAYNNVAFDLRVNQNNDRTGYATGGIIEDNRFYTIGQIRHYDGIFRENEVGNRAHLYNIVAPSIVPAANSVRAINNDGANQGWYYGNIVYGGIDLDFHGHHHSAGFFAPSSHYHGSTKHVAYMQTTGGTCTSTYASPDASRANGPWVEYRTDNDVHVLGSVVLAQPDNENCLPHMDHAKRWTSVFFNDNLVIDPNGLGLRFEDRDHRADDEQANSENMKELKRPHFHQKWVQLERNTVVGKMYIDVLNAAGTDLWSDNWAKVGSSSGAGRTAEALQHPGAEIVNSHPYRNDAWLDIQDNHIFLTQSTGILVADAKDMTLFQLKNNRGYGLTKNFATPPTPQELLVWLQAASGRAANDVHSDIGSWGGVDRGVQTMASLSNVRDGFRVEHCGNVARGLDHGITATDRIFDDGRSIVASCATPNDWGGGGGVALAYTPAPAVAPRCTEAIRDDTAKTDDFYASELLFDVIDPVGPAAVCTALDVPPGLP
jgi:hypothetical protein